jgi:hypothetical protein
MPEVKATVEELSQPATQHPQKLSAPARSQAVEPNTTPVAQEIVESVSQPILAKRLVGTASGSPTEKSVLEQQGEVLGEQRNGGQLLNLNWQKLIEYTREHFVAVYSVLSKCSYETNGDTLILYTGNAFYKKKLDDPKHRQNLAIALTKTDAGEPTIETIPTTAPLKDSQAAAVAAIMGGGEEVAVDA